MADRPTPAPSTVDTVIESAAHKQRADLDINEFAEVADQNEELIARAKARLESKEQWEALKQTITTEHTDIDNVDVAEDEGSKQRLQNLEAEIDAAIATAKPEVEIQASPENRLKSAAGKIGDMFRKAADTIGNTLSSMGSSATLFLASLFGMSGSAWGKGIERWLRGFAEPGMIKEAMAKTLGKEIESTPEDRGYVETLHAQYQAKLAAEKKDEATYSFETFWRQKIDELSLHPADTYTLADLVNIPSAEAAAVAVAADVAKEEEATKVKTAETLRDDPRRAWVEAFRDALNSVTPNAVSTTEGEEWPQIVEHILKAFSKNGNKGHDNFHMEIDGGVLEESDQRGWFNVDDNVLYGWEAKMRSNPVGAIRDFLSVNPDDWASENSGMAQILTDVRAFMEKRGITATTVTSGKVPEGAPEPPQPPATPPPVDFAPPMM